MLIKSLIRGNKFSYIFLLFVSAFIIIGCNSYNNDYGTNVNSSNNSNPPANEVWMQNDSYNPKSKTITKGTEITWVNKDSFNHTVTSGTPGNPNGLFDSGNIGANGNFKHKYDSSGTFKYYCRIHQDIMTGTLIVQ